jgi:hypothetical protein
MRASGQKMGALVGQALVRFEAAPGPFLETQGSPVGLRLAPLHGVSRPAGRTRAVHGIRGVMLKYGIAIAFSIIAGHVCEMDLLRGPRDSGCGFQ